VGCPTSSKILGSVAKSGTSAINAVLAPGEKGAPARLGVCRHTGQ